MISPRALALGVLGLAVGVTGCRRRATIEPTPVADSEAKDEVEIDAKAVCTAGCRQLDSCIPALATEADDSPDDISARLAETCDAACESFSDQRSSLALRDCLALDSCDAYWGCVSAANVRPWLAAVAPVGDRSCVNLCSQASACAMAKGCAVQTADQSPAETDACVQDQVRRGELEETCLRQCQSTAEDSSARTELIGCIDHGTCDGLLGCLESWAETDYGDERGLAPGVSPTCDAFCTRAIVCGAAQEEVELDPEQLDALKQRMTSTYIECAVQCEKDLDVGADAARERFETCTAVEDCPAYTTCALEV